MLKRSMLVVAAVLAAATLSACGLVAAFIPDQEVSNPLGINNERMESTLQDTEPEPVDLPTDTASQQGELATAAEGTAYSLFVVAREINNADDTLPLNPAAMEQPVGFARFIVTKETDDGQAFPDTVAFEGDMGLWFWDGFVSEANNATELNAGPIANSFTSSTMKMYKRVYAGQTVTFNKDSDNCTTRRCVYLPTEATVATLNFNGSDVRTVVDITKPDTASNTIVVVTYGAFVSDPPLPGGASVELIIQADTAIVKF